MSMVGIRCGQNGNGKKKTTVDIWPEYFSTRDASVFVHTFHHCIFDLFDLFNAAIYSVKYTRIVDNRENFLYQ